MKTKLPLLAITGGMIFFACSRDKNTEQQAANAPTTEESTQGGGSASIQDNESKPTVLKIAINSPSHKTLVAAVQAADLVDVLATAGPFTVFAPTDEAFKKLPAGTVEGLLKPEKKGDLQNILQYHVAAPMYSEAMLKQYDGKTIGMANDGQVKIAVKDGKITVNGANIIAAVEGANGIVYVVDAVLLPPSK